MGTVLQVFITFGACISQENVGIKCENIYFCLRDIIFFYTHFFILAIHVSIAPSGGDGTPSLSSPLLTNSFASTLVSLLERGGRPLVRTSAPWRHGLGLR